MSAGLLSAELLFKQLGFVRNHLGGYYWKALTSKSFPLEILFFVWPPGSCSKPHDHGRSFNFSILLSSSQKSGLVVKYYSCRYGNLKVSRSARLSSWGAIHLVAPFEVHEILNDNLDNFVFTAHFYLPRRDGL